MIIPGKETVQGHQCPMTHAARKRESSEPYRLHDFLDDQRRLISLTEPRQLPPTRPIEVLDGQFVVIRLAPLREVMRTDQPPSAVFDDKYGEGMGAARLSRFRLVVDFLEGWRPGASSAGGADDREVMEIRKEFVQHLLNWRLGPQHDRIPDGALDRFVDQWGHRWV